MTEQNTSVLGSVHHHGITVSDVEEALTFYRDRLGFDLQDRFQFSSDSFDRFVDVEGADVTVVFVGTDDFSIELLEYREPPGKNPIDHIENNDVGATHLCFEVDDAHAVYQSLLPEVDFVSEPQTLENGATVAYMRDPDGNLVEILEE
ncbi:MAG: VOC family protein [Halodesulfurarchaeum sp.]